MSITDKLQKLYLKMGGDPNAGASNVEEWIDKIEDVAGANTSEPIRYVDYVLKPVIEGSGPVNTWTIQMPAEDLYSLFINETIVVLLSSYKPGGGIYGGGNISVLIGAKKANTDESDIVYDFTVFNGSKTLTTYDVAPTVFPVFRAGSY